jgi:hypothetical protein
VPEHLVRELHAALGLRDQRRLGRDLEVVVVRLLLPKDGVRQAPTAPRLVLHDLGAPVGQQFPVFGRHFLGVLVGEVRGDQRDDVIEPHSLLLVDFNPEPCWSGEDGF